MSPSLNLIVQISCWILNHHFRIGTKIHKRRFDESITSGSIQSCLDPVDCIVISTQHGHPKTSEGDLEIQIDVSPIGIGRKILQIVGCAHYTPGLYYFIETRNGIMIKWNIDDETNLLLVSKFLRMKEHPLFIDDVTNGCTNEFFRLSIIAAMTELLTDLPFYRFTYRLLPIIYPPKDMETIVICTKHTVCEQDSFSDSSH